MLHKKMSNCPSKPEHTKTTVQQKPANHYSFFHNKNSHNIQRLCFRLDSIENKLGYFSSYFLGGGSAKMSEAAEKISPWFPEGSQFFSCLLVLLYIREHFPFLDEPFFLSLSSMGWRLKTRDVSNFNSSSNSSLTLVPSLADVSMYLHFHIC